MIPLQIYKMSNDEKKIILIIGKRGSGKTYFAKRYIADRRRLVVFDTLQEYTQAVSFDSIKDFAEFWQLHQASNFRLVYKPIDPKAEFDQVADLVGA